MKRLLFNFAVMALVIAGGWSFAYYVGEHYKDEVYGHEDYGQEG